MCNFYAKTTAYPMDVHAFAAKAERDAWVDERWEYRDIADADSAHYLAVCGGIVLHGGADVPKSWDRTYTTWAYDRTADPSVRLAYQRPR